jgi:rSAM/selenodomain-associated transferase 1
MDNLLILFIKYPEPGRVKTRLGSKIGYEQAALLYEQLVKQQILDLNCECYDLACYVDDNHTIDQYQSKFGSDLNFFIQKGRNLGERMAQAIEQSFKRQYKSVILMGSDIPLVKKSDLNIFFKHLLTFQMVIGPARDGGYYMIGFQRGIPILPLFQNIAWSTPDVFEITLTRASELNVKIGKTWFDIDTLEDLNLYRHLLKNGKGFAKTHPVWSINAPPGVLGCTNTLSP